MITDRARYDQCVGYTLVIAFLMMMLPERAKSATQHHILADRLVDRANDVAYYSVRTSRGGRGRAGQCR
jgi:hypothetical protein